MGKELQIEKGIQEGSRALLSGLLEAGRVAGIFCQTKNRGGGIEYSLIRTPEGLARAVPFHPLMPVNAGQALSQFTLLGPAPEPILAVLRPCELRALVELVKRGQGSLDNIITLSCTCPGVRPIRPALREPDGSQELRESCQICQHPIPTGADMTLLLAGREEAGPDCRLILESERALSLLEGLDLDIREESPWRETLDELLDERREKREQVFQQPPFQESGLEGLTTILGDCIGCHGCGDICPICYCAICFFKTANAEHRRFASSTELARRGGLKAPPLLTLYHLGRMTHMAFSCVGCGMCSDICPVEIPVATLFLQARTAAERVFEFEPGRDVHEPVPLQTFQEQELEAIGE